MFKRIHFVFDLTGPLTFGLAGYALYRGWIGAAIAAIYLVPVALYRLMMLFTPQREGADHYDPYLFHPWGIAMRTQYIYDTLPLLEDVLRLLPPVYSLWLRLWGSKIGARVFFGPKMVIHDRAMLEIGNDVIFGQGATLSPHLLQPRGDRMILILKKIKIGHDCLVGGRSYMGPGCELSPRHSLAGAAYMVMNMKDRYLVPKGEEHATEEHQVVFGEKRVRKAASQPRSS
jgi:hypothetical protein